MRIVGGVGVVVLGVVLAGCAAPTSPGPAGEGTAALTPAAARPTGLPVAAAPPSFVERAETVARIVREQGLPAEPVGLEPAAESLLRLEAVATEGDALAVTVLHGACDDALAVHAVELPDLVVLGGTRAEHPPGRACDSIGLLGTGTLTLAAPLGDRAIVDVVSGTVRVVGLPAS